MSWGYSATGTAGEIEENLRKAEAEYFAGYNPNDPEMVESAKDASDAGISGAVDLIHTGVIGDERKTFRVNVGGHANPGNEPAAQWTNDYVTVSVNQL